MKKIYLIALVLLSSIILAGCTPTNNNGASQQDTNATENIDADFSIEANHLRFSPDTINAEAGSTITVAITSIDDLHDFVIDELDVNSGLIGSGKTKVVTITIPEDASGKTFEFYCSVGDHRALGMVGELIIK